MPKSEIIKVEFKRLRKNCGITEILEYFVPLQMRTLFHLTENRCWEGMAHAFLQSTGHFFSFCF